MDASDLAIATADGRVKISNAAQQKLRADITQALNEAKGMQHNSTIYSCMDWSKQLGSEKLVYLGSTAGEVKAFDTARSELRWSVFAAVDGGIAAVSAGPSGRLLVVGKTGTAALVDNATGAAVHRWRASKHVLSAGALLPDGRAVIAGSGISIFDPTTGERVGKLTGHATPIIALAVSADGKYCCTAAEGERQVAVWSLALSQNGKLLHKSAVARLDLENPPTQISITSGSNPSNFHVVVVTRNGDLRVFECSAASDASVSATKWAASRRNTSVLQAVATAADAQGASLVVASGSLVKPTVDIVRVAKESSGAVAVVEVSNAEGGILLSGQKQKTSKAASSTHEAANILGAGEETVLANKLAGAGKRARDEPEDDGMEVEADIDDDQQKEQEEEELTFAQRLANLQQQQEAHKGLATSSKQHPGVAALDKGPVKADSLSVLLTQAIQSSDKILLERCLIVKKEDVIKNSVRRLAPGDAAEFLRLMVLRLQSSPARGEQLTTWIRAVLLYHTGYLAGIGGMSGTLGYLYQLIESRLASYQPLLALSGRLDVVLANARMASEGGAGYGGVSGDGPLVHLKVGSDGAVEVEDAFAAMGGESSDDEDSFYSDEGGVEDADLANGLDSEDNDDDDDDDFDDE